MRLIASSLGSQSHVFPTSSYVQELEARLLYMEQLFKQHAPDVEVFPKEGSGLPPHMAKNVPVLAPFPSAIRPQEQSLGNNADDLDILSHVHHEDESALADHFGQMALDAEGHLRCALPRHSRRLTFFVLNCPQVDRWIINHDPHRNLP